MQEEIERNESCIRDVLSYNRIEIRDIKVLVGPAVSLYKVYLVPGESIGSTRAGRRFRSGYGRHQRPGGYTD